VSEFQAEVPWATASTVNRKEEYITISHLYFSVEVTYRLKEAWNGTIAGTSVEESTMMLVPYILANFSNRTAIEVHTQILNNLEMLMDFAAGSENEDVFVDRSS